MSLISTNFIKASIVCAAITGLYALVIASISLKGQLANQGINTPVLNTLFEASKVIDDLWSHLFEGWYRSFLLALISCVLLLIWLKSKNA
jgi:hypothetical protein